MKSVLDCARALIDMLEVLADRGALPFGMPEQVQALRDAIDRDSTCSDARRDQFAGQAMQALLMTDMVPGAAHDALAAAAKQAGRTPVQQLALDAFEVADQMLVARQALGRSA